MNLSQYIPSLGYLFLSLIVYHIILLYKHTLSKMTLEISAAHQRESNLLEVIKTNKTNSNCMIPIENETEISAEDIGITLSREDYNVGDQKTRSIIVTVDTKSASCVDELDLTMEIP